MTTQIWYGVFASNHMCFAPDEPILLEMSEQSALIYGAKYFGVPDDVPFNKWWEKMKPIHGLSIQPVKVIVGE